jgi:hypothetical protein
MGQHGVLCVCACMWAGASRNRRQYEKLVLQPTALFRHRVMLLVVIMVGERRAWLCTEGLLLDYLMGHAHDANQSAALQLRVLLNCWCGWFAAGVDCRGGRGGGGESRLMSSCN